jgi:hypothetical protein
MASHSTGKEKNQECIEQQKKSKSTKKITVASQRLI